MSETIVDLLVTDAVPQITIAMPVYNGGADLRLALVSLLKQTFTDWELLLIDDGSTDGAVEGLADLADARVRILRDGNNRGLAVRLNEAINLACGRYFARMDQDDVAYPERLVRQYALLEAQPNIDLVTVRCLTIDSDNELVAALPFASEHATLCATPWKGFYLPHPTWMGRTEWFRRYRYAQPGPYCAEDQELLLRSYRTSVFAGVPEVLFAYRLHSHIAWKKLWRTRVTIVGIQLRQFLSAGQWQYAMLAAIAFVARVGSDVLDAIARPWGGVGSRRQRAAFVDKVESARWQNIRYMLEEASKAGSDQ